MKRKIYSLLVVFVSFIVFSGCVIGAVAAVNYVKDMDKVKLTMQTEGNARDIFDASVHSQKTKFPETEVLEENRDKLLFEGKRSMQNGKKLWFEWQMKQIREGMTRVEMMVKGEGMEDEAVEEHAVKSIQAFCSEIGKKCEIKK